MPENDLKQRTFQFAMGVGKLLGILPDNLINRLYFRQLIRCSSSVGANYRASQRAKSDNDFINKLKIVEEEVDESLYFLELLIGFNPNYKEVINPLILEAESLLRIIVASIKTKRQNLQKNKLY